MRQVITTLVCDRCGSEDDVTTVPLNLSKVADLCAVHADELDAALGPFLAVARERVNPVRRHQSFTAPKKQKPVASIRTQADPSQSAVRAWASANGHPVANRGRVKRSLVALYREAGL